jgi:PST family polysaccharide transporter
VLAFGITGVVLTANGMGVWGLVIAQYASVALKTLLSWGWSVGDRSCDLASYAMWRELISYGRHTIAATTVIRVGEEIPVLLLGRFTAPPPWASSVTGAGSRPAAGDADGRGLLRAVPAFARIATERERFHASVLRALRWMAILAFGAD